MALVELPTINPYGKVVVNTDNIFAFHSEPATPADDTELLPDSNQHILVNCPEAAVASAFGNDFVTFTAASMTIDKVSINRTLVVHILPHPQQANVCFIHGKVRRLAVIGNLDQVRAALS